MCALYFPTVRFFSFGVGGENGDESRRKFCIKKDGLE